MSDSDLAWMAAIALSMLIVLVALIIYDTRKYDSEMRDIEDWIKGKK